MIISPIIIVFRYYTLISFNALRDIAPIAMEQGATKTELVVIGITAFLVSGLTLFSGFGLGTVGRPRPSAQVAQAHDLSPFLSRLGAPPQGGGPLLFPWSAPWSRFGRRLDRRLTGHFFLADKGVVMRYLRWTTSYSRQQLTRLIGRCLTGRKLTKRYRRPAQGFPAKYPAADVMLLAQTDALHQTLSGPATRCLMQRAFAVYGDARYARLATLSVRLVRPQRAMVVQQPGREVDLPAERA